MIHEITILYIYNVRPVRSQILSNTKERHSSPSPHALLQIFYIIISAYAFLKWQTRLSLVKTEKGPMGLYTHQHLYSVMFRFYFY